MYAYGPVVAFGYSRCSGNVNIALSVMLTRTHVQRTNEMMPILFAAGGASNMHSESSYC